MNKKRISTLIVALLVMSTAVAGCGKKDVKSDTNSDASIMTPYGKYPTVVPYTIGKAISTNSRLPAGDTYENNLYTKYVNDKLNVKSSNAWEANSPEAQTQKISLAIASGNIPDVMLVDRKTLKQLVDNNLIADLTDAYKKCLSPFLTEQYGTYGDKLVKEGTFDGKLMGISGTNIDQSHTMLWLRKDWLDKLGLQPPKTIDDLQNIAQQFIQKDPGGNGAGKTVGLVANPDLGGVYTSMNCLDTIFSNFGAYPKQWMADSSGKAFYGSIAPEMKPALTKLNEMYSKGILDKEFGIRSGDDTNALLINGKCGMTIGQWWEPWPLSDGIKVNPKANWVAYAAPLDSNGKVNVYSQDPVNLFMVVKKGFAHPELAVKVLNVEYDALRMQDPTTKDIYKGLGTDWAAIPIGLQIDYNDQISRITKALNNSIAKKSSEGLREDIKTYYEDVVKNSSNPGSNPGSWAVATARVMGGNVASDPAYVMHDPVFFGVTPTMETKWANLQKLEKESFLKMVMGQSPISDFDKFVQTWKQAGGDDITKEVNKLMKK